MDQIYLLRVAIATELMLQTKLRQHIIERIIFILQHVIVVEVYNFTSFNEHDNGTYELEQYF